jgi:hypothetical protein
MRTEYKRLLSKNIFATFSIVGALCLGVQTLTSAAAGAHQLLLPAAWHGPMAIDGVWVLSTNGKRVRIEDRQSFAEDSWVGVAHGKRLSRGIHPTGPGAYAFDDLLCGCRAEMKMAVDGTLAGVSYSLLGPVGWTLHPLYLDHPRWFQHKLHEGGGNY